MSVAYDNSTGANTTANATSLTFSHTVSTTGRNLALGVGVAYNTVTDPTSVTYNAVGMTKEVVRTLPVDGDNSSLWKLEAPTTGANNVVITVPTTHKIVGGAVSVTGADQTDCTSNSAGATGTSTSPSVTVTSADNEFVMANIMSINGVTWTAGTNETERWDLAATGGTGTCSGWGGTEVGASSVTIAPTQSASAEWGICAMSFRASGINFDAASNSGEQLAKSSYSWNHTCTGTSRYLTVKIGMFSLAQTVSSITYNSVALTFLGAQSSVSGAARVEMWGLIAPSTGVNSIAVTLTGSINSGGVAASYTEVHQTSPTEAFNSAQATNVGAADATVDVTTVADKDWVADVVATDDTTIAVGTGQFQRNNIAGTVGSVGDSDEGSKTPAGSVTMSWTNIGAAQTWAIGGIALRPTTAAGLSATLIPNRRMRMGIGT